MATAVEPVARPLFTNAAHRIDLVVWQTDEKKTRENITGVVIIVLIEDGASVRSYTATHDTDLEGECHIDLNSSNHGTAAAVDCQVHLDGIPKGEFELTFRTKMAAT